MKPPIPFQIQDEQLWMSADRCIYWESEKTVIVSDTHIGKTGHFRKSGIAVPQRIYTEDLQRLLAAVLFFKAERLIVVGDLSHSESNKELELFRRWRSDFSALEIHLVKGNHDILNDEWYSTTGIQLHHDNFMLNGFVFRHDLPETESGWPFPATYLFSGHVHPGVRIRGMGKQALYFPCFHFTEQYCVLPAFSRFTGLASLPQQEGDRIFAIVEDSIIRVQ